MHWADINAALIKSGWPQIRVSTHLEVTPQVVSAVIRGQDTSYNVASFISSVTSIPLNTLWPDGRYRKPRIRASAA